MENRAGVHGRARIYKTINLSSKRDKRKRQEEIPGTISPGPAKGPAGALLPAPVSSLLEGGRTNGLVRILWDVVKSGV